MVIMPYLKKLPYDTHYCTVPEYVVVSGLTHTIIATMKINNTMNMGSSNFNIRGYIHRLHNPSMTVAPYQHYIEELKELL